MSNLLDNGADINAKDDIGLTVSMEAVQCYRIEVVVFLLQNGADVNAKDYHDNTVPFMQTGCSTRLLLITTSERS